MKTWQLFFLWTFLVKQGGTESGTSFIEFGHNAFDEYNENAEIFLTGVLIRLSDDEFHFGPENDQIGLKCQEGFIRPIVMNRVEAQANTSARTFHTKVIMKNLTLFYKECRVSKESKVFPKGNLKARCFLTVDIAVLIGSASIQQLNNSSSCRNEIKLNLGGGNSFVNGVERMFFLQSLAVYTTTLRLKSWRNKLEDAVQKTSRIFLSQWSECI